MNPYPLPLVPWDNLTIPWRQGEHVTLIGPTGCGKTTVAKHLLPIRRYVLFVATKPNDDILLDFKKQGYKFVREFPNDINLDLAPKQVFLPNIKELDTELAYTEQAHAQIGAALRDAFRRGGFTIYLDELREIVDFLKLSRTCERIWLQGRSNNVSMVGGMQRPRHAPLSAYSQATHLFLWGGNDDVDLKRVSEISGRVDRKAIRETLLELDIHEFVYVNTRDGFSVVSQSPK